MDNHLKYLVLSYPRTGSTLFISSLGQHPDIEQGMEVFNGTVDGTMPWAIWRRSKFKELYGTGDIYRKNGNIDESKYDFTDYLKAIFEKFNGIKIIYDQLGEESQTWKQLSEIDNLKIIYMQRNIVDAAVSFFVAKESRVWQKLKIDQDVPPVKRRKMEPGYFDWYYDFFCTHEKKMKLLFCEKDSMTIQYEEMIHNWDETMISAQEFLGIKPIGLTQFLFKRTARSTEFIVSNYLELKKCFKGKYLGEFFRDHRMFL